MSTNSRDGADNIRRITEGTFNVDSHILHSVPSPTFVKMIVIEVISDPNTETLADDARNRWLSELGVSNFNLANALPRNTIVAKEAGETKFPMFLFPFFPSHLSLPCKPGELVWAMFDNPAASRPQIGYWFCRVVDVNVADDVNHSHPARAFEKSLFPSVREAADAEKQNTAATGENVWHELRNGPVVDFEGDRHTSIDFNILKDVPEDIFELLVTETVAAQYTTFESIPRFRKRPADVVLEGSNNSLIVLGTDRDGPLSVPSFAQEAGAIDMVTGRGCTPETLGVEADTTSIKDAKGTTKGTPIKKELNKSHSVLSPTEGDPDYKNDRSRILISQRTNPDSKFGLTGFNSKTGFSQDDSAGEAAIVIKSDKVRMIARSDLELVVTNYTVTEVPNRQSRKDEEADLDKWASIMIKTNGDIIFKPSKLGFIKLGGEDADKGIVCSDEPVSAVDGNISGPSLVTTMGGFFAGAAAGDGNNNPILAVGQAKFANKVLIK